MNRRNARRARYASMPQGDRWKKAVDAGDVKFVFRALNESGTLQKQAINDSGRIRIGEQLPQNVQELKQFAIT